MVKWEIILHNVRGGGGCIFETAYPQIIKPASLFGEYYSINLICLAAVGLCIVQNQHEGKRSQPMTYVNNTQTVKNQP